MMRRPFVRSIGLLGRLFAILLVILLFEFAASTLLYEQSSRYLVREDEARRLAEHLVIARDLVAGTPPAGRPRMAERLTTPRYAIGWSPGRPTPGPAAAPLGQLARDMRAWEPTLVRTPMAVGLAGGRRPVIRGALALGDGSWLAFTAAPPAGLWQTIGRRVALAVLPASLLALIGVLAFRATLRPIGTLARAAERIGRGGGVRVPVTGPAEVRRLIRAFNSMQARIRALITERTEALAAVGHDLRTPLARLQLRTDAVADDGARAAMRADVDEMEAMLASLLAYLGGDSDPEKPVRTDVAVLAATLVDGAQDRGLDADYHGPDHLEATVRPLGLKRALGNLLENALHYGGTARVSVATRPGAIVLAVEDDGPGIPPDRLAAALQPFTRLDPARGRNTSGLGLGLTIVQGAIEAEGGRLTLANRAAGGLRAELFLPVPS